MEWLASNWIFVILIGLAGIFILKTIYRFFVPNYHFKWGWINYLVVKRSHQLTRREMIILKRIGEEFKASTPSSLVGNSTSLDYYFAFYISGLFKKKKMNELTRTRILGELLEIRRKFALVPLKAGRIRNTRFFAAGSKVRVYFAKNKYYQGIIGDNRYGSYSVTVPTEDVAEILKRQKKIKCIINRLADAQYSYQAKILYVSSATKPMFVQFKHSGSLKRKQLRQDLRKKVDILSDIIPIKPSQQGKRIIFIESLRDKSSGFIRDISTGGCALGGKFDFPPGTYCKLVFKILGEKIEVNAKIIRQVQAYQGSDRKTIYFRFIGLPLKHRVLIQLYVYHLHPTFLRR